MVCSVRPVVFCGSLHVVVSNNCSISQWEVVVVDIDNCRDNTVLDISWFHLWGDLWINVLVPFRKEVGTEKHNIRRKCTILSCAKMIETGVSRSKPDDEKIWEFSLSTLIKNAFILISIKTRKILLITFRKNSMVQYTVNYYKIQSKQSGHSNAFHVKMWAPYNQDSVISFYVPTMTVSTNFTMICRQAPPSLTDDGVITNS